MPYRVRFASPAVEHEFGAYLSKLDEKTRRRIAIRVDALGDNPRPSGKPFKFLSPPVVVRGYMAPCRLRIGDHRVLYDISDETRTVVVIAIRRRSESTYRE